MVLRARFRVHSDRLENGVRDLLRVPWVHDDTAVQTLSRAGELGQDHDTLTLLLASDVLV